MKFTIMHFKFVLFFIFITFFNAASNAETATPPAEQLKFNNYQVDLKDARLSLCPDVNDPILRTIKSPEGKNIYAFKEILPEHYSEWKGSLVRDEIILSNVISIPDVVCQKKNLKKLEFFTPIVDFLGWKQLKIAYHPRIGRAGWIVRGWEPPQFNSENLLNQMKIIGSNRVENFKYESPYVNGLNHTNTKNTYLKVSAEQSDFIFKHINHKPAQLSNFWKEVLDSSAPVYLTEGTKKAGSLLTVGYPSVSINGVCAGMHIVDQQGRVSEPRLREDMLALAKNNRLIYIVFDNDDTEMIKSFVFNALEIFAGLLEKAGARVKVIDLPGPEKGVDDFLVAHGHIEFKKLAENSVSIQKWRRKHNIKKGDLNMITQYFACRI